jgi:hypothetical protein
LKQRDSSPLKFTWDGPLETDVVDFLLVLVVYDCHMINRFLPGSLSLNKKKSLVRVLRIDLVRRLSKGIVSRLPKVAHEAALEQICNDVGRFEMISRLAPDCNVVGLKVSGMYGVIQSVSDDRAVLMQYAKNGTWAERTNELLTSFFAGNAGSYIDAGARRAAWRNSDYVIAANNRYSGHARCAEPVPISTWQPAPNVLQPNQQTAIKEIGHNQCLK